MFGFPLSVQCLYLRTVCGDGPLNDPQSPRRLSRRRLSGRRWSRDRHRRCPGGPAGVGGGRSGRGSRAGGRDARTGGWWLAVPSPASTASCNQE